MTRILSGQDPTRARRRRFTASRRRAVVGATRKSVLPRRRKVRPMYAFKAAAQAPMS
jgi:hypothetical protein